MVTHPWEWTALPTLITVDELAAVLRCQPEKVYRLAARGELPSYKVEGRRLFDESEIVRWLETQRDGLRSASGALRGGQPWLRSAPTEQPKGSAATTSATATATDGNGRESFSAHKDAQAFKLDVERRQQAGLLYQAAPERFSDYSAGLARALRARRGRARTAAAGHGHYHAGGHSRSSPRSTTCRSSAFARHSSKT